MNAARLLNVVLALVAALSTLTVSAQTDGQSEFFEKKIRPVLAKCSGCHGEQVQMGSLQLTTVAGLMKGASTGPIVVKGDPEKSRLIQAVSYQSQIKMPPTGKLPDDEIQALREWVNMGVPWPEGRPATTAGLASVGSARTQHWAFQPIKDPIPPIVKNQGWIQTPIDSFILAKLEEKGLSPAIPADRLTLLRRAKFDLHGLSPTEQEIDEFLADTAPGAFDRLVDRLLASPRYGERWGRHWLDIARYADETHAWRYRDYVITPSTRTCPITSSYENK